MPADPFQALAAAPAISRAIPAAPPEDPAENEQSLLKTLGYGALSGLEKLGNVLDLPGSMVRDVLVWDNPFDQLLSPLSHGSRGASASGREVLDRNFLTDMAFAENKESGIGGWSSDPWEGVSDVLGFGVELATDPLSWVLGGSTKAASSAGKAGKVADVVDTAADTGRALIKHDGVADAATVIQEFADPLKAAGSAVTPPVPGGIWRKVGRGITKAGDVMDKYDPGFQIGRKARSVYDQSPEMQAALGKVKPYLSKIGSAPLSESKAFIEKIRAINETTESAVSKAEAVAGGMSSQLAEVSDAARRLFKQQMTPEPRGRSSQIMQDAAKAHTLSEQEVVDASTQSVSALMNAINEKAGYRAGSVDEAAGVSPHALMSDDVINAIETDDWSPLDQDLIAPAQQAKVMMADLQRRMSEANHTRKPLQDQFVDFAVHDINPTLEAWEYADEFGVRGPGNPQLDAASNQRKNQSARDNLFRDAAAGRRTWNGVTSDPEILETIKDFEFTSDPEVQKGMIDAATAKIKEKYGSEIDPRMIEPTPGKFSDTITLENDLGESMEMPWDDFQSEFVRVKTGRDLKTATGRQLEFSTDPYFQRSVEFVLNGSDAVQWKPSKKNLRDRHAALADYISRRYQPLSDGKGIFSAEPLTSMQERIYRDAHTIGALKAVPQILQGALKSGVLKAATGKSDGAGYSLKSIFTSALYSRSDRRKWYDQLADKDANLRIVRDAAEKAETPDVFYDYVDKMRLDKEIGDEILATSSMMSKGSSVLDPIMKGFRGATALFKSGVLTHPARYIRDLGSSVFALYYNDMVSDTSLVEGTKAFFHKPSEVARQLPQVQAWLAKYGLESTPENATRALHEMYAALKGHGQSLFRDPNIDTLSLGDQIRSGLTGIEGAFPGTGIRSMSQAKDQIKRAWKTGTWDPFDIAGVPHILMTDSKTKRGLKRGDVRTETAFKFGKVGELIGKNVDDGPRFVGFLEGLLKGKTAQDSWNDVSKVLLDYDPKKFGPLENKVLKKVFPFYSFLRQQSVYMANELMTNPTGRLGKLIRVARLSQPHEQYLPEHISESMAIPVGGPKEDGTQNYLTGLGLMFEDPPRLIPDSAQDVARSVLSRTNPLIKGIAELGLGRSSFQGGPLGSRDLADMDPVLGRIFTNLGLQSPSPGGNAKPAFGSRSLEFMLSNSPISRLLSTTKTLTEGSDRKNIPEKLLNTLTGIKITSVSPQVRQRGLRELANSIAKELGSRPFETFHISQELLDDAADDPERLQTLLAIKELRKVWDARRKQQVKAEKSQGTALDVLGVSAR